MANENSIIGIKVNEKNLPAKGINCSLFEHNNPTTTEFLRNLSGSYTEIEKEVEEEMERKAEDEEE